jgi:L-amino acid N-acyltransferase YncA
VERAHRYRHDVRTFGDDVGVVLLGRGVADRLELAVELFDHSPHGEGHGRRLIDRGLLAAPRDQPVWAQVAPGNAASLRAFLAAGFVPVGAEVLLNPN